MAGKSDIRRALAVLAWLLVAMTTACKQRTGPNALVGAARSDELGRVQSLLGGGVKIDEPEKGILGETALMAAAGSDPDHTNVFYFLLASGAKVDGRGSNGKTALMEAVLAGDWNIEKVRALIKAGADVNAISGEGQSVLDYAEASSSPKLVDLLKTSGARGPRPPP
jgi:ankyrin repeat protein